MLEKYSVILIKVYQLALKESSQETNSTDEEIFGSQNKSELLKFLLSQDLDVIKVIQAVMYIGIENPLPETEEEYVKRSEWNYYHPDCKQEEPEFISHNPEKLLNEWIDYLATIRDWVNKDDEAYYIYEKSMALSSYLEKAFHILGISSSSAI